MELKPSKYIPSVDEDVFGVTINGRVLTNIPKEQDKFLAAIGAHRTKFFPKIGETPSKAEWKKEYNKRVFNELGMSPKALHTWAKKLWFKHNVGDVKQYYRLFRKRYINTPALIGVKKNKALLDQAVADGQHNLLPILHATGKTPSELREKYGKGLWKGICSNSFSRNMLIAKSLAHPNISLEYVKEIQDAPSALLHHTGLHCTVFPFLTHSLRGKWGDAKEMRKWSHIAADTYAMARKLSEPFNQKWSARRMKEEHDRLTALELAKKYSKDTFPVFDVDPLPFPFEMQHENGLIAVLLTSPYEMQMEGRTQRHCVAGYSSSVAEGKYLVYSVRDAEGNRKSTIGLYPITHSETRHKERTVTWRVQQHYAACNQQPSEECKAVEEELMKCFV